MRNAHWRSLWTPLLIAVLALTLRLLFLFQLRETPLFDSPGLDAAYYLNRAREIAAGDWLGNQVFFMAPLYPYCLALIGKLTNFSMTGLRLVQAIAGAGGTILLFLIGRRLFDLRVATLAALGLAGSVIAIYYDNLLLMTSLVTLLNIVVLWDLTRLGANPGGRRLLFSGALLGLAALGRASLLLFAPAVLVWLWVRSRPTPPGQSRPWARWRPLAAYAAGLLLVLGLTATRNAVVGGDLVLITSNGGLNLFIGNNPLGRGTYLPLDQVARAAGVPARVEISWMIDDPSGSAVAEAATGRHLQPSEVSDFFTDRTLQYVRARPGRALEVLGRKLLLFWNATEIAQIEDPLLYRQLVPLMRWPLLTFGVLGPLALLGMVIGLGEWRRYLLLYLYVGAYTLSIVLFFVTSRYRAPIAPVLLLFAAYAGCWLVAAVRSAIRQRPTARQLGRLIGALGVLGAAACVVHLDLIQIDRAAAHINLGIAYAQDERYEEAIESFQQAVSEGPRDVTARYNLAAAQLRAGQPAAAGASFAAVLELDARSVAALVGLGQAEKQRGNYPAATGALRRALAHAPQRGDLWLELATIEANTGHPDSAVAALTRVVELDPGAAGAWDGLMQLHLEAERHAEALTAARHSAAGQPGNPQIHSQLGMLEAMQEHPDRAAAALRQALTIHPAYLPARLGLARLFLNTGHPDSARHHLQIAHNQSPNNPQLKSLQAELPPQ